MKIKNWKYHHSAQQFRPQSDILSDIIAYIIVNVFVNCCSKAHPLSFAEFDFVKHKFL